MDRQGIVTATAKPLARTMAWVGALRRLVDDLRTPLWYDQVVGEPPAPERSG